jgi:hypothetical protein
VLHSLPPDAEVGTRERAFETPQERDRRL